MYPDLRCRHFLLVIAMAVGTGCASHSHDLTLVRQALLEDNVPGALEEFEKLGERKSDLLYLLERGYMFHLAGRWQESNEAFEAAERRFEELYTKSISRQAISLISSDLALPYRSTPFEMQIVQYYRALNYMALGLPDEALVEARKANHILKSYEPGNDSAIRQDAFIQYVTGLLYESQAEINDAIVSFRESARLYSTQQKEAGWSPPRWVNEDYYAAARHLELYNELDALLQEDSTVATRATANDRNNLVLFFESGFVPFKEPVDITFPVYDSVDDDDDDDDEKDKKKKTKKSRARHNKVAGRYVRDYGHDVYSYRHDEVELDHILRFSFPELLDAPRQVYSCELELADGRVLAAVPAMNLAAIARQDFDSRLSGILLKTVARALVKEAARKAVKKEDEALGFLFNLATSALEQADTRGWVFLPGQIFMLKAHLDPGPHVLTMRFLDHNDDIVDEKTLDLDMGANGVEFVSVRSFR